MAIALFGAPEKTASSGSQTEAPGFAGGSLTKTLELCDQFYRRKQRGFRIPELNKKKQAQIEKGTPLCGCPTLPDVIGLSRRRGLAGPGRQATQISWNMV